MPNSTLVLPAIKSYKFRKQHSPDDVGHKNTEIHLPKIPIQGTKKKKTETVGGYLEKKRQQFQLQYDLHLKEDEVKSLQLKVELEEEKLNRAEKELKEESKKFDQYLQECKTKATESGQKAETMVAKKLEKTKEIKRLENQISNVKSEILKIEDSLGEFRVYENFLSNIFSEQISPDNTGPVESWNDYDPKDFFKIFQKLQEQNLNILGILIREEQVNEDAKKYSNWIQNIINDMIGRLKAEDDLWKSKIEALNKTVSQLEQNQKKFDENLSTSKHQKQLKDSLELLDNKINLVYNSYSTSDLDHRPLKTMEMLAKLENRLEQTMAKISRLPAEKVQEKQRLCVQRRAENLRRCRLMLTPTSANQCPRCQQRRRSIFYD